MKYTPLQQTRIFLYTTFDNSQHIFHYTDSQSIQSDSASLKNAENNLEVPTQVKPVPLKSKTFVQVGF